MEKVNTIGFWSSLIISQVWFAVGNNQAGVFWIVLAGILLIIGAIKHYKKTNE